MPLRKLVSWPGKKIRFSTSDFKFWPVLDSRRVRNTAAFAVEALSKTGNHKQKEEADICQNQSHLKALERLFEAV
jgi:hypothetical protein